MPAWRKTARNGSSGRSPRLLGCRELVDGADRVERSRETDVWKTVDHRGGLHVDIVARLQVARGMGADLHLSATERCQHAQHQELAQREVESRSGVEVTEAELGQKSRD